jgi:hypothetical protein
MIGDGTIAIANTTTSFYATVTGMPYTDVSGTASNQFCTAGGANVSLMIKSVYACAMTATANQEIAFGPTVTSLGVRTQLASKGNVLQYRFDPGWILETNTNFGVWLATTGAIFATVEYDIIQRGAT